MADPSFVHGVMPRTHIGRLELADAVAQLTNLFEIPLYVAQRWSIEDIKNSFTAFKASEESTDLWKTNVRRQNPLTMALFTRTTKSLPMSIL